MEVVPEQWWTSGMIFKERLVCQYHKSGFSAGFWHGENPINSPTSLVLFQMFIIFVLTRSIYFLFQPLRQSMIVAQILAGFLLGPSLLTHNHSLANKLFPPPARFVLKTISSFGFMLHLFIMGVKIDMTAIKSSGAKSIVIGMSGLLFSLALGSGTFIFVRQHTELDQSLFTGIRVLIFFNSLTFFIVTAANLNDLKISNSELGRLACSSSLVIDTIGLLGNTASVALFGAGEPDISSRLAYLVCITFYYAILFCVFRPIVLYIVRRTPQGATTMKQSHLTLVLVILMLTWYWGQNLGQHFATFLFGLSLPDGPPLGSALVQKIELFTSRILLPVFCTMAGWRTNPSSWKGSSQVWGVELIFVIGHLGKFLGTVLSSVAVGLSLADAVPLGFMMSFKGVMEVATFSAWCDQTLLDDRLFSLSMINILLFTGVAYPLAQHMYDPSTKYSTSRKRRLMGIGENGDLRVLVCIHDEETVPSIVNLLKLCKSNSAAGSIAVFGLQLIQLTGSSMPILEPLYKYKKSATNFTHFEHAVNAFDRFEKESQGYTRVQHYVSVTPYKSMHNDICALAHDNRTGIIITPFHKSWGINGNEESSSPQIKEVNRRVLRKAPCSVAILIDKKGEVAGGNHSVARRESCSYQIAMLFIGGSDDQEALALASRMAEHPTVTLTVVWLKSKDYQPCLEDFQEDIRVMTDFHLKVTRHENISLIEQVVADGIGTTKVVLSVQHADLFIVGNYHEPDCPAIRGLTSWSKSPEIGALGDMLATSDFLFSILVVQHQPRKDLDVNGSRRIRDDDILSVNIDEAPKSYTIHQSRKL